MKELLNLLLHPVNYGEWRWCIGEPRHHWHPWVRKGWQRIDDACPF